jgi:hypothetical protein
MKFRETSCLFREITKDISPYFAELSRNGIPLETLATNSEAWSDTARIYPRNLVRRFENLAKNFPRCLKPYETWSVVGCPTKLISYRNNQNWNRNQFRHSPKQDVCFGWFALISKQGVSVF